MKPSYDPWAPAVMANPYPFYDELRADGGCHELPDLDMWVLSTHEHVSGALRDHRSFSSIGGVSREASDAVGGWISEDPPSHSATRAMASPVFTRSAMTGHLPAVRGSAASTVERFVDAGGGDVVTTLAQPIAVEGLCAVLGVPNDWPEAMTAMSETTFVDISARSSADRPTAFGEMQLAVGIPLSKLIEGQLDRTVPDPSATMLDMITAHVGDDAGFVKLDQFGRAAYLTTLVSPGVETTRTMISNAIELAARHPEIWDAVRTGSVDASAFISEVLRYESPIQGFFRSATRSIDLRDKTIPEGARVLCLYGSANRDDDVFEHASTFRPGRENAARHLAYGAGIHRCIGAWLAETEGLAAVEALAERVARFEVTDMARRTDMAQLRALDRLVVTIDLAPPR